MFIISRSYIHDKLTMILPDCNSDRLSPCADFIFSLNHDVLRRFLLLDLLDTALLGVINSRITFLMMKKRLSYIQSRWKLAYLAILYKEALIIIYVETNIQFHNRTTVPSDVYGWYSHWLCNQHRGGWLGHSDDVQLKRIQTIRSGRGKNSESSTIQVRFC